MWGSRRFLAISLGVVCAGCTLSPSLQHTRPAVAVDVKASQLDAVTIEPGDLGGSVDRARAEEVRAVMAHALEDSTHDAGSPSKARFRAKVLVQKHRWPVFACLLLLPYLGCPSIINTATVTLTTDVDGKLRSGTGESSKVAGYYYTSEDAVIAEATVKAYDDAMKAGD